MKAKMHELDQAYYIEFAPETMEEQIMLVRFGLNVTKERMTWGVDAHADMTLTSFLSVSRRKVSVEGVKA